jgi:hypothetical protein
MKLLAALFALAAIAVWFVWDSVAAWWTEPETYDPRWFDCLPADEFFRRAARPQRSLRPLIVRAG